jgi:hypothetical protein
MSPACLPNADDGGCSPAIVTLLILSVCLTCFTGVNFMRVVWSEKDEAVLKLPRVQILNLRFAMMVPLFSVIALFQFVFPISIFILEV